MQGKVLELFITKANADKTRLSVTTLTMDSDGVLEDKFYKKDPLRSILITSIESYRIAQESGIEIPIGSLGENILIDISPYHLKAGETFTIGSTCFEITQNCTLCQGLSRLNAKLPKLLKNDRGVFAKVISGKSEISIDDRVEILEY